MKKGKFRSDFNSEKTQKWTLNTNYNATANELRYDQKWEQKINGKEKEKTRKFINLEMLLQLLDGGGGRDGDEMIIISHHCEEKLNAKLVNPRKITYRSLSEEGK